MLLITTNHSPESQTRRDEETGTSDDGAQHIPSLRQSEETEAHIVPLPPSPHSPSAPTPISPVPSHRRGVDEEVGIGISTLPPIYTRNVLPRHSVVAVSPESPRPQIARPEPPPAAPQDEPLPEYSRYPKSEAEVGYRGGGSSRSSNTCVERKKICGIHMRSIVTGVVILITACIIAGSVVGYQIKNQWLDGFKKDDTSNYAIGSTGIPNSSGSGQDTDTGTMSDNFYSNIHGDGFRNGHYRSNMPKNPNPTPTPLKDLIQNIQAEPTPTQLIRLGRRTQPRGKRRRVELPYLPEN